MFIVRDKGGALYLYEFKPVRHVPNFLKKWWNWCKDSDFYWIPTSNGFYTYLDDKNYPAFKNVKWEDEPLEVDITPINKEIIREREEF